MATNGKTQLPVKRSPWTEMQDLRDSVRAMIDGRWPLPLSRAPEWTEPREPAVDMFERDGNLVVKAEMPAIEADEIDVTVSDQELRITGERKEEKEVKQENYYRSERSVGRIYRTLALPEGCDSEVSATAKDGVIEVVIPKKATAVGKKVEVRAG
jgi:HSP20 family protein